MGSLILTSHILKGVRERESRGLPFAIWRGTVAPWHDLLMETVPNSPPADPEAGKIVAAPTKTEREIALEVDLEKERKRAKDAETAAAYAADELHNLRKSLEPSTAAKGYQWTFFAD
jgi:hypothetical protein